MNRITIALLSAALVLPGAGAFAQERPDDRGVVKADPTMSDDTITAVSPEQDVIEGGRGTTAVLPDADMDMERQGAQRMTEDDRGVVKADPTYSDDTITATSPEQDVIETPGG